MTSSESWFIVKQASNECKIFSATELAATETDATETEAEQAAEQDAETEPLKWGPFETQNQAIAKRVGLIRAGKCQPS